MSSVQRGRLKNCSVLNSRERKILTQKPTREAHQAAPSHFLGLLLETPPHREEARPWTTRTWELSTVPRRTQPGRPIKFDQGAALRRGPWAANADHCEARPCRIQTWMTRCFSLLSTKLAGLGFILSVSTTSAGPASLTWLGGLPEAARGDRRVSRTRNAPHEPALRCSPRSTFVPRVN